MKKRLFSLLLAAVLIVSLLPAVAMATGTTLTFTGNNMTLTTVPTVNFHVTSETNPTDDGYSINVTIDGTAYTGEITPIEDTANGTWVYKVPVMAGQLTKTVKAELVKDEATVAESTFTLQTYYEAYVAQETADENMVALLAALINYGKYAAYYHLGTEDPAVEAITELGKDIAAVYEHNKSSDLEISAMLVLDEACTLRIAIPAASWQTGYSLKVNGEYVAPKVKTMDGYVVHDIAGILPQQWDSVYEIQVLGIDDAVLCTMNTSVMSYVNRVLNLESEDYAKLQSLMKAMFAYYRAADEYVGVAVKYEDAFTADSGWTAMGNTVGSWTSLTEGSFASGECYVKVSDGKLQMHQAGDSNAKSATSARKGFTALSGIVGIEFDVAYSELESNYGLMFNIQSGSTAAVDIRLFANKVSYYTTESNDATGTYVANETYRVKIIADTDTDKFSLYIDNNIVFDDAAMRNAVDNLNAIRLYVTNKAADATATYDNLIIYQLKSLPTDTTDPVIAGVLSDSFTSKGSWGIIPTTAPADCSLEIVNNQMVVTDNNTADRLSAKLDFTQQTGKVGFEFNVSSDVLSEDYAVYFTIFQGGTQAIDVQLYSNAIKCYDSDNKKTYAVEGEYLANETYRVKIVADVTAKTYSVYIDGTLIVENVPMRNSEGITGLSRIRLWTHNVALTCTVTYDNLVVYTITETTAE